MTTADSPTSQIVIAGAGPVGLALALEMGLNGIATIVLDGDPAWNAVRRNRRANAINTRAMEYMRRLGVSPEINAISARGGRENRDVAFVTSLTGYELTRFVDSFESSPNPPPADLSPEQYLRIDQDEIAQVLRDHIARCPSVTIMGGWRLEDAEQDADGATITAQSLTDGSAKTLRANWLIGADGGASTVRKRAGITFDGEGGRGQNINITCAAPAIRAQTRHAEASMFWIVSPDFNGFCGGDTETFRMTIFDVSPETEEAIRANPQPWIDAACGTHVPAEVLSIDRWTAHQLVASRYRAGRIFLAGDAAHLHPPTGGLGMNTGIGDAGNLGWKLAAFIAGWGDQALLDSYDTERRPYGQRVVDQANSQYNRRPAMFLDPDLLAETPAGTAARARAAAAIEVEKASEFFSRGLVLGQTWRSAVIVDDGSAVVNTQTIHYTPTAQAGARLPAVQLQGAWAQDLIARDAMTLFALGDYGAAQVATIETMAANAALPLHSVTLNSADAAQKWQSPLLIVRPDGHVAWHGKTLPTTAALLQIAGKGLPHVA